MRVRRKRSKAPLVLGSFEGRDLYAIVDAYLSRRNVRISHDTDSQKLIRVANVHRDARRRVIEGIIETGEYGYEAELYDVRRKKHSYRRNLNEAEMLPFYFLFSLPKRQDEGILILQRFKALGIRKALLEDFESHFREVEPDFVIEFNPILPEAVIRKWVENGTIRTVKLVSFTLPFDLADLVDRGKHEEVYSELVIRARHRRDPEHPEASPFTALRQRFRRRATLRRVVELRGRRAGYDAIKLEVEVGDSRRTVDLGERTRPRAFYDITIPPEQMPTGHPTFESVSAEAQKLLKNISAGLLHFT